MVAGDKNPARMREARPGLEDPRRETAPVVAHVDRDHARLDADLGPCDTDRRHIFNLSMTATTPNFAGAASVLSDWRLSGVFRASSGSPFSVTTGLDRALTGNPGVQRASVAGDPYLKTGTTWLNPASFSQPALGTFGNSERNAYEGPGVRTVDLALVRAFTFAGTQRIEARAEAFGQGLRLSAGDVRVALTSSAPLALEPAVWWPDMGEEQATTRVVPRQHQLVARVLRHPHVEHDAIVRGAIETHGGYVFSTGGDGFAAAFQRAADAVAEGDTDQAMAWFADSMRLRDVIQVVSSIEIPIPGASDDDEGPMAA